MKKQQNDMISKINAVLAAKLKELYSFLAFLARYVKDFYLRFLNTEDPFVQLMRLESPLPILLSAFPAIWSVAMVGSNAFEIATMSLYFIVGATFMRGAGCVFNDIVDCELDKKVIRTQNRPLARGALTKIQAVKLLIGLLFLSACMLMLLPKASVCIGVAALFPIVAYPFLKQITYYPQVLLGFVFNIGAPIAWASFGMLFSWPSVLVYLASILWTIGYDTIYAYQDKEDDINCGVKSTAIKFGDNGIKIIWQLYQFVILMLCIAGMNMHMNTCFYLVMALAAYQLYWQTETLQLNNEKDCAKKFESNVEFAFLVFAAIMIGRI